jgi:hypothetical protein
MDRYVEDGKRLRREMKKYRIRGVGNSQKRENKNLLFCS